MKNSTLTIGLLAASAVAVSVAQAGSCCPRHNQATNSAQVDHGGHAHNHGEELNASHSADESDKEIKLQTTCPVMGGKIDKNQYVDHDGKRIYICCKGCEAPLKQDPEKYIQKLEGEGVTVAKLQTECPVMELPIDEALYVDHDGKRIYVCCQGCVATVEQDPAKHIKSMEKLGIALYAADRNDEDDKPEKRSPGRGCH